MDCINWQHNPNTLAFPLEDKMFNQFICAGVLATPPHPTHKAEKSSLCFAV